MGNPVALAVGGAVLVASPALAQNATIADIAPPTSYLVAGVSDWSKMADALKRTDLGELWASGQVRGFVEEFTREPIENLRLGLEQIGAEDAELHWPTGPAGVAVFFSPDEDGLPGAQFIAMADFGDDAGEMREVADRFFEHSENEGAIEVEEHDEGGRPVLLIRKLEPEADEEPAGDDGMDEDWEDWEGWDDVEPEPPFFVPGIDELFFTQIDTSFVISSSRDALRDAIDVLAHHDAIDSVRQSDDYLDALAQHEDEGHVFAALLLTPVFEAWDEIKAAEADEDEFNFGPDEMMIFRGLGLDRVRSVSASFRADTPAAMAEMSWGVAVDEKTGLAGLLDFPAEPFDPPAMVGADAAGVNMLKFNFAGVMDVVRGFIAELPEEEQEGMAMQMAMFEQMAAPVLASIGPGMAFISSFDRPYSSESQQMVFCVQVSDNLPVQNLLAMVVQQGVWELAEFEGNPMYVPTSEFVPIAVGLGFGHAFVGSRAGIESAMRRSARPDGPRLATEPHFLAASRVIPHDGFLYSWADMRQILRYQYWRIQNADTVQRAQLEAFGLDEETIEEIMASNEENQPDWTRHLPPVDLVLEHLGDTISEARSTPDGFRGRSLMLRPAE